ncbi:MAG: iron-containing alcohol dehydrogenase [Hyphomicrobiaceae bacterium]
MTNTPTKMNWSYPTRILFGPGRIAELGEAAKGAGFKNPLIVTDPGLAKLPVIAKAKESLEKAGIACAVWSEVVPNPTESNMKEGIAVFKKGGHDSVIAIGGGSGLDQGKLVAFMAGQTRSVFDFEDVGDWWTRANADAIAPIIAVPTTAGTGSEVGRAAVVTNEATHEKKIIFHPKMLPVVTILDPELTVPLPAKLTAGTGMDALAHCLEAYCAPTYHPMGAGIAMEGIYLVKEYLVRVVKNPSDLEARGNMMTAAAMGATAFQKGLGAIHSLSHPVGGFYNTHHGLTNAVYMPYVLAFNRKAIEEKIERLARSLGISGGFDGFQKWILELRKEVGVPHTLKELGVPDTSKIDEIAKMAVADPSTGTNPVPLDEAGAKAIFLAAFEGKL